jgi:hypothetical protein
MLSCIQTTINLRNCCIWLIDSFEFERNFFIRDSILKWNAVCNRHNNRSTARTIKSVNRLRKTRRLGLNRRLTNIDIRYRVAICLCCSIIDYSYHSLSRNTNKMQLCNRIYFKVFWRLNMFRPANSSSSGALNCICGLSFICPKLFFPTQPWQRSVTVWAYRPKAANTV